MTDKAELWRLACDMVKMAGKPSYLIPDIFINTCKERGITINNPHVETILPCSVGYTPGPYGYPMEITQVFNNKQEMTSTLSASQENV